MLLCLDIVLNSPIKGGLVVLPCLLMTKMTYGIFFVGYLMQKYLVSIWLPFQSPRLRLHWLRPYYLWCRGCAISRRDDIRASTSGLRPMRPILGANLRPRLLRRHRHRIDQLHNPFAVVQRIVDSRFHCRRDPQARMNPAEVVVYRP